MKRLYNKGLNYIQVKEKAGLKPPFLPIDILLIILTTILCIIFEVTPVWNETTFQVILSPLFILFIPGYSFIAALFSKKNDLDDIERFTLSFSLSIIFALIIGLLLNYTHFGIKLTSILLSLSAFTILMSSIAYIKRLKLPSNDRFTVTPYFKGITGIFKNKTGIDKFLPILLIISIILAVSMTTYALTTPKQGEMFTEFYILGSSGKASNYPTNLTVGEKGNVLIGAVNHENTKTDYHMVAKLNGNTIKDEKITLLNNAKWEDKLTFNSSKKGKNQKLDFLLYKLPDNTNVYRSLHIWVNVY